MMVKILDALFSAAWCMGLALYVYNDGSLKTAFVAFFVMGFVNSTLKMITAFLEPIVESLKIAKDRLVA